MKHYKVSNAIYNNNYNSNTVRLHNIESMNVEYPECKAIHWIEEK
ncbi:27429_t:CDS:1, partial [Racocetra persica]